MNEECNTLYKEWETYKTREFARVVPILKELGFSIEQEQPHIEGERYLMSGQKLVLLGRRLNDNVRVIIKVSSEKKGKKEIRHERTCRTKLHSIKFAYRTLLSPNEFLYVKKKGMVIFITGYIEQEIAFLGRPLEEQFFLALDAFKTQESVHATTTAHVRTIRSVFGVWNAQDYTTSLTLLQNETIHNCGTNKELVGSLRDAEKLLKEHTKDIERYCGFLTHEDFALHNFRVSENKIYLIDHSSLRFGNKHESWARFLNFMLLYNRGLEETLVTYMRNNRAPEENLSLQLMRVYKLAELLNYHARAFAHTEGRDKKLSEERIIFWTRVLFSFINNIPLPTDVIENYKRIRDTLRSEAEKQRQRALQQL